MSRTSDSRSAVPNEAFRENPLWDRLKKKKSLSDLPDGVLVVEAEIEPKPKNTIAVGGDMKLDVNSAQHALVSTKTLNGLVIEGNNHKVGQLLSLHGHLDDAMSDLKDVHTGQYIVVPCCKQHAQNMLLVAEKWLKDNT